MRYVDGIRTYQKLNGYTNDSKKFVCANILNVGKFEVIEQKWDDGEYRTTIFTESGNIVVDGFGNGYSGEGPRGLAWLLETFGFRFADSDVYEKSETEKVGRRYFVRKGVEGYPKWFLERRVV